MQIENNGGKATVADLSGCTALFFYMDKTLRRVVHVMGGNEATDAKTAVQASFGAVSITIKARDQDHYDATEKAILAAKPGFTVNKQEFLYDSEKVTDIIAITLRSIIGATTITQGTGLRTCKQSQ